MIMTSLTIKGFGQQPVVNLDRLNIVCRLSFIFILITLVSIHSRPAAAAASRQTPKLKKADVGPLLFSIPSKRKFRWSASLNTNNGQASSTETSTSKWFHNYPTKIESKRSVQRVTHKLVSQYPKWLVRPKVTFGLLRATANETGDAIAIQPIIFDIDLLIFGTVQTLCKKKNKYKLKLPIKGGILALTSVSEQKGKQKDYGCLTFQTTLAEDILDTKKKPRSRQKFICQFESEISGNYCPWVAGPAPVPTHRKWTYLSSQSIVHAYVMWRFHQAWSKRIITVS